MVPVATELISSEGSRPSPRIDPRPDTGQLADLTDTPPPQRSRIPTLDGWRGIAITLVLMTHAGASFFEEQYYFQHSLTRRGVLGVSIFFGLSGLLITRLLLQEFASTGRLSLKAFYIRRFFRIQPPLLLLLFVLGLLGCYTSKWDFLSALLFWRNYASPDVTSVYTGHIWSLSIEEHFYLLWPALLTLMLFAVGGRRAGRATRLGVPLVLTFSTALLVGFWRSADSHWHWVAQLAPQLDPWMRTDYRMDSLLFGCVMAFLMDERWCGAVRRQLQPSVTLALCALLLVCVFMPVRMSATWIALLIPLLILSTALHPEWPVSRVLELKPITWLGRLSFSIYLWQQVFILPSWHTTFMPWSLQVLPVSLVAAFACAAASYYLMERPLLRVGRRLSVRILAQERSRPAVSRAPATLGRPAAQRAQ